MTMTQVDDRWNPFSWRAAELAALGDGPSDRARRDQLELELLVAEADRAADGGVHLAVVHGDPTEGYNAGMHVGEFYDHLGKLLAKADWHRLLIEPDHIIIEIAGAGAQDCIDQIAVVAELLNPGHWRVSRSARPDLSRVS